MRPTTVSLDLFTDSTPWLASGFGLGRDMKYSEELKKAMRKIIEEELTPLQKELIFEYYYGNTTMTAIAEKRGVNKSSVSRTLKTARERIAHSLKYGSYHIFEEKEKDIGY